MQRRNFLKVGGGIAIGTGVAGCVGGIGGGGGGSEYPNEDISVFHPYGSGGTTATLTLMLSDINQEQDILPVDIRGQEKTGGGGIVAYNGVYNADPDGYTISESVNGAMILKPLVLDEPEYDPTEYSYLPCGVRNFMATGVAADSDIESGMDFVNALKEGQKFAAVSQTSSITTHFIALGGATDLYDPGIVLDRWVQYPIGEQMSAIAKGEVSLGGTSLSNIAPFVENGDIKVPLFFHPEDELPDSAFEVAPNADTLDDLPIDAEEVQNITQFYPMDTFYGWIAPPGLSDDVHGTLSDAMEEIMETSTFQDGVRERDFGVPDVRSASEVRDITVGAYESWNERDDLVSLWTQ